MTVMFHDLHENHNLHEDLHEDKVIGALFHEILYADDTILASTAAKTINKRLEAIERWEKVWNDVKYCSEKCRRSKSKIQDKK